MNTERKKWLMKLMIDHEINQRQVAEKLDILVGNLNAKLNGKRNFTFLEAMKLSIMFGIPLDRVFEKLDMKEETKWIKQVSIREKI